MENNKISLLNGNGTYLNNEANLIQTEIRNVLEPIIAKHIQTYHNGDLKIIILDCIDWMYTTLRVNNEILETTKEVKKSK
jgi:hypothetical protein